MVCLKVEVKVSQSCLTLQPQGLHSPWNSPGQNTGVDSLSLLQGILPTQGSSPGLPHCRRILHHPSHQGSPCFRPVTVGTKGDEDSGFSSKFRSHGTQQLR